ncbi:MAG: division/cell wall cluster transcriptional repressor MraZ [Candidatus Cloacimonas sp. 4484_209]|nr:MAG: division/cell wall cluster transcriptional repressor MraZ [Candidatus Cloacimonas sp. 4484_209]
MVSLSGCHSHSVDHKGRVFIPSKLRKRLITGKKRIVIVTRGFDKCLSIYSVSVWKGFEDKLLALPQSKKKNRFIVRYFMENKEEVEVDSQGRVKIPQHLLDYAGIEKEVLIAGVLNRIELWNPEIHRKETEGMESIKDEILEDMEI